MTCTKNEETLCDQASKYIRNSGAEFYCRIIMSVELRLQRLAWWCAELSAGAASRCLSRCAASAAWGGVEQKAALHYGPKRFDNFVLPFHSTTLTPPGSPGVSRDAKLSTEFEFGTLVR